MTYRSQFETSNWRVSSRPTSRRCGIMQFLYMGFTQERNIRSYRFHCVLPKERGTLPRKDPVFSLKADIAALNVYRIRIQEGPSLCLQILGAAATGNQMDAGEFDEYTITEKDLSTYSSATRAIEEAKVARRKPRAPFKPSASSQLRWPQTRA